MLAHHLLAHHLLAHNLHNYLVSYPYPPRGHWQFEEGGRKQKSRRGKKSQLRKMSLRRKKITKIAVAIPIVYILQLISFIAENNTLASYLYLMYLEYYS